MLVEVDIEHRYRHGPAILARFTVALAAGRSCALVGPSGAGKTTVLRVLAGLERPQRGRIRVDGQLWFDHERAIFLPPQARRTGLIFQDYALYPHRTVYGNVLLPARLAAASAAEADQRVRELLELVGLWDERDRYPHQLSGGQQQRLALARALACHARLLLMDEPFAALDQLTRHAVREQLFRLVSRSNVPLMVVGHDWQEIAVDAHWVIVMASGRVVAAGPPDLLADQPPCRLVAELAGYRNVFPVVRVRTREQHRVQVDLGDASLLVRSVQPTPSGAGPLWCCVHPESIIVENGTARHRDANVLPGTVETVECAVRPARVTVRHRSRLWSVQLPLTQARTLRPGATVRLVVPEDAPRLVQDACEATPGPP